MSKSFVIVVDPCNDAATPPITTNRTSWRAKTPRIGRGSNMTFLADAPCILYQLIDCSCCDNGPPEALFRGQGQRRHELCAIDSATGDIDDVHLEVARAKDPLQCAVARILESPLDQRDHRLRDPGLRSELTLTQPFALTGSPDQPTCLHRWKSISRGNYEPATSGSGLEDVRGSLRARPSTLSRARKVRSCRSTR